MDGDIAGVRIIPAVIQFNDTEVNVVHRINVTVKNVSKTSKSIRYYGPQTKNFKLKVKNPENPVAAGLEVPAIVEFITPEAKEHKDRLVITVDDDVIEVPLIGYPAQPLLQLEGPVDFGHVVANSKVIAKEISLYNHGSKTGEFKIKYSGEKPIAVFPSSGSVPPKTAQIIKIEYVTKQPGRFDEEARVKLEGQEPVLLRIQGSVVEGGLQLLSPHTDDPMERIRFGSTYYGTDKTEVAMLYNNGPEMASFVCVLEEEALGQEVGVDLTKSTAATVAEKNDLSMKTTGELNKLTSLVTAIPNQGVLGPYERIPVFFRFSPRWNDSQKGFISNQQVPPRQDFALFMHIQMVGSKQGFTSKDSHLEKSNVEGSHVEVALTGTALPTLLGLVPQTRYDFGECPVGEHVDTLCALRNESTLLPVTFQFRRVAHFTAHPPNGKIKPGQAQDIIFSFAPNQIGSFKPTQYLDVIGQVADNQNPFLMHLQIIHSLPIQFLGKSNPMTRRKEAKFNAGITPAISNEVGQYVETTVSSACKEPKGAMQNAKGTKMHRLKSSLKASQLEEDLTLVAFPNDRSRSIRPSERDKNYRTIFTHVDRYTYVDPDYAYTDEEERLVKGHRQRYVSYIDDMRNKRTNIERVKEFKETNNKTDIGIKAAAGLKPKKIAIQEVGPDPSAPAEPNENFRLLSSKELTNMELKSIKKTMDGLNAVPTTRQEKEDCAKILSPQQLHQIVIGPPTIDYGEVCLRSVSNQDLNIVNNLNQYIHVVVDVDCRELRQTSPLSQVVPPCSKATLPLIFESNTKGKFQRSVDYTINGFYKQHVIVLAEVVQVALHLSTDELMLHPAPGMPAEAGIRGVITLSNKLNYPAEFTWTPILGERGMAFSIRPATGQVDAFKDLDCEVVFHPSFLAPEEGDFALQIHGGNPLKLKCIAQLGETSAQFIERRIMFSPAPLHLTSIKSALLQNTSQNHAFYQVLDPNPFPGLTVQPLQGVVPVGGYAEIKVYFTPNAVLKFDTRVQVAIRGWKTIELRMGGTVEPPCVDIDVSSFNLGGVYCGSSLTTSFTLTNKTSTKTRMDFDLSRFADFQLHFPGHQTAEDHTFQMMNPGLFTVTLSPDQVIQAELLFEPSEVASYDFIIPVTINQTGAPSPSPTPFPPTPAPSTKNSIQHIINPRPVHVSIATPRKRVVATALRQPLQLSHNRIEFSLSPGYYEMSKSAGIGQNKQFLLVNNSDQVLKWKIDLNQGGKILEEGTFKFLRSSGMPYLSHGEGGVEGQLEPGQALQLGVLFCPNKAGHYEVTVPVYINDEEKRAYQHITLCGELKSPMVWFDPLAIVLTPVPLGTDVSVDFSILAATYQTSTVLDVELPEVECDDGSKISPLAVTFPDGQEIKPCCGDEGHPEPFVLSCKVTFNSPRPVSFCQPLNFVDSLGNIFSIPVTATADNCLLTCYPFLAQHRTDHQIVCEQDSDYLSYYVFVNDYPSSVFGTSLKGRRTASKESVNVGEAVFVPCISPPRAPSRPSTAATSSNFQISSSSYEDSSQSVTESTYPSTPRDGALNKAPSDSEQQSKGGRQDITSRSLGSALFPEEDTEEGIFHTEVLLSVQRWFSAQGWPGGPHPINIPEALRSGISKKPADEEQKHPKGGTWEANNLKKEFKTVYDMMCHLCGRQVPGIPINQPIPREPTERAKQIYWQHATLLTFLKAQGACVASIKPEYLMEPTDYKRWVELQRALEAEKYKDGIRENKVKTEEEEALEDQLFEAVSKRAWTDVLLQLLKTLVLARITPRQFKNLPVPDRSVSMPVVNPDPLCSNVYSMGERIVLAWLNHHYEQQRNKIWEDCTKGGVPPSRWIVNFDYDLLDGLVIAAALGAHLPFLVKTHLHDMYTRPSTAEQCLHNALKVVNAMRYIGMDYDIQAIDITDPNPILLLLLTVHLYQCLPQYLPKTSVEFIGSLHATVVRQVKLSNPSSKPLTYHVLIAGLDARDFKSVKGDSVTIPPKSTHSLAIEFKSRFLRPAEAVLVLVGRRAGSSVGSTLVFNLRTQIDNITPRDTEKCESPCYELHKIALSVTNPFKEGSEFRIVLVEAKGDVFQEKKNTALLEAPKRKNKKITSKIDAGKKLRPETPETPPAKPKYVDTAEDTEADLDPDTMMSAFFCPAPSIYLEGEETSHVELHFLPFHTGKRQCSIILISEEVGEVLYSIEATAHLPLPSSLPFKKSTNSVRISSAAAAGHGRGLFGGDDRVVYWKCESHQVLKENLSIPVTNSSRERALIIASQQHMTEMELQRRRITGTLASATITARTQNLLTKTPATLPRRLPKVQSADGVSFTVEADSEYFSAPRSLFVPNPLNAKPKTAEAIVRSGHRASRSPAGLFGNEGVVLDDGTVDLPVTFNAKGPGHYPCKVILRSQDDIRVYHIECTVNPEGSNAHLEFTSPVHQSVTQDIPVVNQTTHDWPLEAIIEGSGFFGPTTLIAKASMTSYYPLMFRPHYEAEVDGKLLLTNKEDGTEHIFSLHGKAEKPLPVQHIVLKCEAKQKISQLLPVPNVTSKKLHFRAESDIGFVSGKAGLNVLQGQTVNYTLTAAPLRRGVYKGVMAFVAGSNPIREVDSDGDEIPEEAEIANEYDGYRVWYSLEIHVSPPKPEKTLEITCACQKKAVLEIGVNNPLNEEITLETEIVGQSLSGHPGITLPARAKGIYELDYFPAIVGTSEGSLIFFHESTGEFWYKLMLVAEPPIPTTLKHMECELGRWVRQYITLNNPTDESLELIPTISNTNNFTLERSNDQPIVLRPRSQLKIPLNFMPSTIGEGDHKAKISFHSAQLGEWVYTATGSGLLPQPQDPVSIYSAAGSNSTLIIPFRNPMDHAVIVDVVLTDKEEQYERIFSNQMTGDNSPFCLLLKTCQRIRIGPKSTLEIPLSFAPEEMRMYEALCVVVVRQEGGGSWKYDAASETHTRYLSRSGSGGLREIRWLYPIHGIPESVPRDSQPAIVECQARCRVEERLEVTLSGVAPSAAGPERGILARALTPKNEPPRLPQGIVVGEVNTVVEEFTYELMYDNQEDREDLASAVVLKQVRQYRDKTTGLVVLIFNVIFAPYKTMSHNAQLMVRGATGGVWKFPVRFVATEPEPDDVIVIEAAGLNKESSVGFRLTSQTRYPVPFTAYFVAGSDAEFSVSPQAGELLPVGTNGTMIRVTFSPTIYGKNYLANLVVQTSDMQWTYCIKGNLPQYAPPRGLSSRPMAGPHPDPRKREDRKKNFVRDNLKLTTTAVSSPIKGASVVPKGK